MLQKDSQEIIQDLMSNDKEKRERSALSVLINIRKKVEDMGDPPLVNTLYCSACLLPIQNGDFAYCMNCCNSVCHISCLAKISDFDFLIMEHQCPNCSQKFSKELIQQLNKMQQIIDNVHNTT